MQAGVSGGGSLPMHIDKFFEVGTLDYHFFQYLFLLYSFFFHLFQGLQCDVKLASAVPGNWGQSPKWVWFDRDFPCCCL
jgi:hypothetical protein